MNTDERRYRKPVPCFRLRLILEDEQGVEQILGLQLPTLIKGKRKAKKAFMQLADLLEPTQTVKYDESPSWQEL